VSEDNCIYLFIFMKLVPRYTKKKKEKIAEHVGAEYGVCVLMPL